MTSIEAGIVTADAEALTSFYCTAFGFSVARELSFPQGEVRRLVRGDAQLKLYQPAASIDTPDRPDPWFQRSGWAYAALHTDNVANEVEAVRSAGGTVVTEATNHRPGAWFALVSDPEGNVWEILQEDA